MSPTPWPSFLNPSSAFGLVSLKDSVIISYTGSLYHVWSKVLTLFGLSKLKFLDKMKMIRPKRNIAQNPPVTGNKSFLTPSFLVCINVSDCLQIPQPLSDVLFPLSKRELFSLFSAIICMVKVTINKSSEHEVSLASITDAYKLITETQINSLLTLNYAQMLHVHNSQIKKYVDYLHNQVFQHLSAPNI